MTPIARKPDTVAWLEHRSDDLIKFFRDLLSDIEKGDLEPVKKELRNAIERVRMDANSKRRLGN